MCVCVRERERETESVCRKGRGCILPQIVLPKKSGDLHVLRVVVFQLQLLEMANRTPAKYSEEHNGEQLGWGRVSTGVWKAE